MVTVLRPPFLIAHTKQDLQNVRTSFFIIIHQTRHHRLSYQQQDVQQTVLGAPPPAAPHKFFMYYYYTNALNSRDSLGVNFKALTLQHHPTCILILIWQHTLLQISNHSKNFLICQVTLSNFLKVQKTHFILLDSKVQASCWLTSEHIVAT